MTLGDRSVKRGDNDRFFINFFAEDEITPINLTGWTVWFTVRKTPASNSIIDDTDAPISIPVTNLDETGVVEINVPSAKTNITAGTYFYDIQYKDSVGNIRSTDTYKYIIENDITRDR